VAITRPKSDGIKRYVRNPKDTVSNRLILFVVQPEPRFPESAGRESRFHWIRRTYVVCGRAEDGAIRKTETATERLRRRARPPKQSVSDRPRRDSCTGGRRGTTHQE